MAIYFGDGSQVALYWNNNKYQIETSLSQFDFINKGELVESWKISKETTNDNVIASIYLYNDEYILYIHGTGSVDENNYTSPQQVLWKQYINSIKTVIMADSVLNLWWGFCESFSNLTSVKLSNQLTKIPMMAFSKANNLSNIILPNTITTIANWAFSGCTSLVSINIPLSVVSIGSESFNNCKKLQYINYAGTIEQWNSPDFVRSSDWYLSDDIDKTGNFTIYCTNGTIAKDGTITYYNV
jgi:hypothetical protein